MQNKDNWNSINHLLLFLYSLNITTTKELIAISIVYSLQNKSNSMILKKRLFFE